MERCIHSIYACDEKGTKAYSCRLCYPLGYPGGDCGSVVLPSDSDTALNRDKKLHANKHDRDGGACPKCGSRIHYGEGKTWTCAERETRFDKPRGAFPTFQENLIAQESVDNRPAMVAAMKPLLPGDWFSLTDLSPETTEQDIIDVVHARTGVVLRPTRSALTMGIRSHRAQSFAFNGGNCATFCGGRSARTRSMADHQNGACHTSGPHEQIHRRGNQLRRL